MKNVILGCVGAAITLYLSLIVLSLYTVYVHQNELDRVLSRVMWSTMKNYCSGSAELWKIENGESEIDNRAVREDFIEEMSEALGEHQEVGIRILACDMNAGVLSAEVSERIPLPGGDEKVIRRSRTIILDRKEELP